MVKVVVHNVLVDVHCLDECTGKRYLDQQMYFKHLDHAKQYKEEVEKDGKTQVTISTESTKELCWIKGETVKYVL